MNNLIVFDIDGTLINIINLEDKLYLDAVYRTLDKKFEINTNWGSYKYSTDAGVFSEIVTNYFARGPSSHESQFVQTLFVESLEQAFSENVFLCRSLPGAENIFNKIKCLGWDVAIATGCWLKSATFKLEKANILRNNIPLATSNDNFERKKIIEVAITRAKDFYKKQNYSNIFYVGDKQWDKAAAEELGIGFIGVGKNWDPSNEQFLHVNDYSCNKLSRYLEQIND